MAREISPKLENLALVMRLYSRGTFGKDAHQWTKCVVKYLTDIYESEHLHVITLLLEVSQLRNVMYCLVSHQGSLVILSQLE